MKLAAMPLPRPRRLATAPTDANPTVIFKFGVTAPSWYMSLIRRFSICSAVIAWTRTGVLRIDSSRLRAETIISSSPPGDARVAGPAGCDWARVVELLAMAIANDATAASDEYL